MRKEAREDLSRFFPYEFEKAFLLDTRGDALAKVHAAQLFRKAKGAAVGFDREDLTQLPTQRVGDGRERESL